MGALLGALSAVSVGISEMFGRRGSQAVGVLTVGVVSQAMAALTALALVMVLPSELSWPDLGRGAISGAGYAVGMVT